MTNVRISKRGMALLQNGRAAREIAHVLLNDPAKLESEEGVQVEVDNTLFSIKVVSQISAEEAQELKHQIAD